MINLFIQIRFLDIIDIILVAILMYQLYALIRGTGAFQIFFGLLLLYLLWWLVRIFEMDLLSAILGQFISVGVLALIIVFQPEIRKFLLMIGTRSFLNKGSRNFFKRFWHFQQEEKLDILPIVQACERMAENRTGALIVITGNNTLDHVQETGQAIDGLVSEHLLEAIFFKNNPLHDGAVIITGNIIKSARCVLPVSYSENIPSTLGLRHRAAVGVTEQSDAIALIVSEQTGKISWAKNGAIHGNIKALQLREMLARELSLI
jgi:diadenylate cyclase